MQPLRLVALGTHIPRKLELLDVDAHSTTSLLAPRAIFVTNGTDTPPGFGDAWADPRGRHDAEVTIKIPDQINVCHRGRTIYVPKHKVPEHLSHGDAIGGCLKH